MLIESVELTLSHLGLGSLTEVPLLALFATAQAHRLTADTGHCLDDVTDADGARLYPGYFWLQLRIPRGASLERHRLWSHLAVGVDVRRYGRLLLDSTYVAGAREDIADRREDWDLERLPSMRAASMWVVDGVKSAAQPASPREGAVAALPTLSPAPEAVDRFRRMRTVGTFGHPTNARTTRVPFEHTIQPGRDVAPGRNLMFATYVELMELAEVNLLAHAMWPALPLELLEHRRLVEREVFFFEHACAGQRVKIDVHAQIVRCDEDAHGPDRDWVSAARLEASFELYEASSNALLTCCRVHKLFLVPRTRATLIADLMRFVEKS